MNAEQAKLNRERRAEREAADKHNPGDLLQYQIQLDAALIEYVNGKPGSLQRLMVTVGVPQPTHPLSEVAGVMKAISQRCGSLPDTVVDLARDWLDAKGMDYE